ncbi:MAG: hypothetical protein PHT94_03770 [Candidatus Nanoarchaeia archaeon]|nr:hypothetical protein [Candidatus Nanoarchaeia archaeon]
MRFFELNNIDKNIIKEMKGLKIIDGFNLSPGNIKSSPYICITKGMSINKIFIMIFPIISHMYDLYSDNHSYNKRYMSLERLNNKKIETMDYKHLQMLFKFFFFLASSVYIYKNSSDKSLDKKMSKIRKMDNFIIKKNKEVILNNMSEYLKDFFRYARTYLESINYHNKTNIKLSIFFYYDFAKRLMSNNSKDLRLDINENFHNISEFFRNGSFNPLGEILGKQYEEYILKQLERNKGYMQSIFYDFIKKNKRFRINKIQNIDVIYVDGQLKNLDCKCPDLFLIVNHNFLIPVDIKINPKNSFLTKDTQINSKAVRTLINHSKELRSIFN